MVVLRDVGMVNDYVLDNPDDPRDTLNDNATGSGPKLPLCLGVALMSRLRPWVIAGLIMTGRPSLPDLWILRPIVMPFSQFDGPSVQRSS